VPKRQLLIEDDLDDDLPKNPIIERSKKRKEEAPINGKGNRTGPICFGGYNNYDTPL